MTRAARVIHPFRSSGLNPRPQRPPQAPQRSEGDWNTPTVESVSLRSQGAAQRAQARVAGLTGVSLGNPPRVPVEGDMVSVHIDGVRVRVPSSWAVSITSKNGRDVLLARDPNRVLHLLLIDADGQLRELHGVPDDLLEDLARWKFPRG